MSQKSSKKVPDHVIDAVEKLVRALEEKGFRIEAVYLFGSYARGDYLETSDIDIIIVSSSFKGVKYTDRLDIIYRIEWELGIKPWIEAIPLTREELEERVKSSFTLSSASKYWMRLI